MSPSKASPASEQGRSAKSERRQKAREARSIEVQRRQKQKKDASTQIPGGSINVEAFVEARAFEMKSMESSMKNARDFGSKRAFQTLPRALRRRAASHNPKRVPRRLQARATKEIDSDSTRKPSKLRRPYKSRRKLSKSEEYAMRQKTKLWLETHIWHAKRMKMCETWGFSIAEQPTAKSFRPSYRASKQGCLIHDTSYLCCIQLKGGQNNLNDAIRSITMPGIAENDPSAIEGSVAMDATLALRKSWPNSVIGPCSIIWKPINTISKDATSSESASHPLQRILWIFVHPSIFESSIELVAEIQRPNDIQCELLVRDLNIFDLVGPDSLDVLARVLKVTSEKYDGTGHELWRSVQLLSRQESAPQNLVIGLHVHDPRLYFPPERFSGPLEQSGSLSLKPSAGAAFTQLWSREVRTRLRTPVYKQKEIDHRKSLMAIPGTRLDPTKADDRVPVLLQRIHIGDPTTIGLEGWRLYLPPGWAMAFWLSFIYCGVRVGGLREVQNQHFDAGVPYFPRDYPSIRASEEFNQKLCDASLAYHERKPPAKRPSFTKVGTPRPFELPWMEYIKNGRLLLEGDTYLTESAIWLYQGKVNLGALESLQPTLHPWLQLKKEWERQNEDWTVEREMLQTALIKVRLTVLARGTPQDMALIYWLPDEEHRGLAGSMRADKMDKPNAPVFGTLDLERPPSSPQSHVIGRLTSGRQALSLGKGQGFGAISLAAAISISLRDKTLQLDGPLCKMVGIKNIHESNVRIAQLTFLP